MSRTTDRFAACPLNTGGTPVRVWTGWEREFPELDLDECPGLVLVAPHPDDETLGFGATAAALRARGVTVQVVSVTDGGAAQPNSPECEQIRLGQRRRRELYCASDVLDLGTLFCLGFPDGRISDHTARLTDELTEILDAWGPNIWCAATWRGDGHPDHEATGHAAAAAAARTGARLLEYPIWMWHWALPDDAAVPWHRATRIPLDSAAMDLKKLAAQAFRTQFHSDKPGTEPVLPPFVLQRLLAVGEFAFH